MRFDLLPFSDRHLDEAAALLAGRHRRDRAACPLLPARFEKPAAARAAIGAAWRRPDARGVIAREGGRLAGYLIGDRGHRAGARPLRLAAPGQPRAGRGDRCRALP